ncbi:hypothetical protein [Streptacidiphilus melanogenes]|uniref:hypothetical protein n=1 Tax=Streptacidiphilus melanogenes TaxID=411235 RepID=UPI0005A69242|nr:hypothetical protein [Streptacidiphilus melanogenes]
MAAGGEEKAVFHALRRDAQDALPKIAERNAHVVDSAVEKGSKNLADHAENEARTAEDFRSRLPKDKPPLPSPRTTSSGASADAPGPVPEVPVHANRIEQALVQDDGTAAADLSRPRFGNDALRDSPNFDDEIDKALEGTGLGREEYDRLRLRPTSDLTPEQIRQVGEVRNRIRIGDGQIVTKVVNRRLVDGYLDNDHDLFGPDTFDPTTFGNSIARGTDTADLTTPAHLRDGLALDDKGQGWTPVPEGAPEAYQLRFPAPKGLGDRAAPSYGAVGDPKTDPKTDPSPQQRANAVATIASGHDATGSVMEDPFTGTGYTAGGVPEWLAPRGTNFGARAEIWRMTPDGGESMVGYYYKGVWNRVDG